MQTILETLRRGSAKERLAVVADILSILGVSLAAVVAGLMTLAKNINVTNVLGSVITSLFALAAAALVLLCFLELSAWVSNRFGFKPSAVRLAQFALWSTFVGLFLGAVFIWFEYVSSFHYVETSASRQELQADIPVFGGAAVLSSFRWVRELS